jgi:hypothetical protein
MGLRPSLPRASFTGTRPATVSPSCATAEDRPPPVVVRRRRACRQILKQRRMVSVRSMGWSCDEIRVFDFSRYFDVYSPAVTSQPPRSAAQREPSSKKRTLPQATSARHAPQSRRHEWSLQTITRRYLISLSKSTAIERPTLSSTTAGTCPAMERAGPERGGAAGQPKCPGRPIEPIVVRCQCHHSARHHHHWPCRSGWQCANGTDNAGLSRPLRVRPRMQNREVHNGRVHPSIQSAPRRDAVSRDRGGEGRRGGRGPAPPHGGQIEENGVVPVCAGRAPAPGSAGRVSSRYLCIPAGYGRCLVLGHAGPQRF